MKDWLIYLFLKLLISFFKILPRQSALKAGETLAIIVYYLSSRHRKITLDNLSSAYKDIDEKKREGFAKSSFKNLGRVAAEFARMTSYNRDFIEKIIDIEGWENFEEAKKKGKGIVFLTGHLGNWELMAYSQSLRGNHGNIIARPLDNPVVEGFVQKQRSAAGNRVIAKKSALKDIIQCLRNKEHVGILLDQNVAQQEGIFVDFFGKTACTSFGLAMLALKIDITIIPVFLVYTGHGRYKQLIGKEIEIQKTGDFEYDMAYNTALFTKVIESYIRKYPEQWFWAHRRWKTQPKEMKWKERNIKIRKFEGTLDLKGIDNV
ncbi:MAG: lysophospholipid acyltransferase family protein [Nitrospirota bacterium]